MTPLITQGRIRLQVEADDWTQAVRSSAELLVRDGCITPGYVEAIFTSFDTNGDYMIVMPEVVLAHARPESGALETGISLVTLRSPVLFRGDPDKPIRIIFTLAAGDPSEHIDMMAFLAEVLIDAAATRQLKSSSDVEAVLGLLTPAVS